MKKREKREQANSENFSKPELIFQTHKSLNSRPELNIEAQSSINLILNDVIKK